jgi:glucose/arabinose dehydrogenase/PKD repeat protein
MAVWGESGLRLKTLGFAVLLVALSWPVAAEAATDLPNDFSESTIESGLKPPTAFDFAPDGRLFIAEQRGVIKVYDDLEDTSATVFADLRTKVHNNLLRGLLGLVVDPQFPERPYVYVLYVYDAPVGGTAPTYGTAAHDSDPCPPDDQGGCPASIRISRLVANGNTMSTEVVLVKDVCTQIPHHAGGGMAIGPEGALYVSIGDGAGAFPDYGQRATPPNPCGDPPTGPGVAPSPPAAEGGSLRSQDLSTPNDPTTVSGSIIRIDPDSGDAWPDNPLIGSSDLEARRIVAHGLRSPHRLTLRPQTDELWVGDVGWNSWEEISRIVDPRGSVENLGWPCYEGINPQPNWNALDLSMCEDLYSETSAVVAPSFEYHHDNPIVPGEPCPTANGAAVTGLAFYEGGGYPSRYEGGLFFGDVERHCIWVMRKGTNGLPDPALVEPFASGLGSLVDLRTGPGGDLFYLDAAVGRLKRIHYDESNAPPTAVIDATPETGQAPLTVSLDGTGSSDTDPNDTLTYAWDKDGDGAYDDSMNAQTQATFTTRGPHTVGLRVTDNHGATGTAAFVVLVGDPPSATIDAPTATTKWNVGEALPFSGQASDADDGALPPAALTWSFIQHHCYTVTDCHTHLIQEVEGESGSFVAPDHEYPAKLEFKLTATDSDGLTDTESVIIDPRTVNLTFTSSPTGLTLSTDNKVAPAPFTTTVIRGSTVTMTAPSPQTFDGFIHQFAAWSDGGALTHSVVAGSTPATYQATFDNLTRAPSANAGPDQTVEHRAAFTLDGSQSSDPDGDPLTYHWVQVGGPPAVIRDDNLAQTEVEGVAGPAILTFQLTVEEPHGLTHTDTVTVSVQPK